MHERKRFMIGILAFGAALSPTAAARAQSQSPGRDASFVGRVESKVGAAGVAGAEVSFPVLRLTFVTDSAGAFRFSGLPAGVQFVRIRRLGFAEWNDTITLEPGASVSRVYALAVETPTLDTVRTREQRAGTHPTVSWPSTSMGSSSSMRSWRTRSLRCHGLI